MALFIAGWICLLTLCQSKVIEVNNEGSNSNDYCCVKGTCLCGSLFKALQYVENNTVINITSSVPLHNITRTGSDTLNNITITGNDVTVACNNSGTFICEHCSNIVIQGIIWDQCGNPRDSIDPYAIFAKVTNISIIKCTFQHSQVCFVVFLRLSSGFVFIHNSRFLFNHIINMSHCPEGLHGTLFISDGEHEIQNVATNISITETLFFQNGVSGQILSKPSGATMYCLLTKLSVVIFHIENLTVSNSFGRGGNFVFDSVSIVVVHITNMTFYNNSNGGSIFVISGKSSGVSLQLYYCSYERNVNGSLKLFVQVIHSEITLHKLSIIGNKGSFMDSYTITSNDIGQGSGIFIRSFAVVSLINISSCNIEKNTGGKSILYISDNSVHLQMATIISSNFTNNVESPLYISGCTVEFGGRVLFMNNSADQGAAMFLVQSQIVINENSSLEFIRNTASQGGAIFIKRCPSSNAIITGLLNVSDILFVNNSAENTGNSIYINNPESCNLKNDSLLFKFNYTQSSGTVGPPISASPHDISVCSTCDNTSSTCHIPGKYMLGQSIDVSATVCDYYGNISDEVQFYIECTNCNDTYRLFSNRILIHNGFFDIKFIAVDADRDVLKDTNITLSLSSTLSNEYNLLTATLSLELSSCKSGYIFDTILQQCICYAQGEDIIQCQQDYAEIKYGYWFGIVVFPERTVSWCPLHYCDYRMDAETNDGYYKLPEELDGLCSSHRTGVACGECKPGYTLAYDSPDCINKNKCSAGMTVLVIGVTILYWIMVVALVFGLMQLKISLGYVYGLIFYYSVVDILLGNNLFISNGVFQLVTILSSFAKLTPQFIGRLCFVQGLSGIDQQFIHYFHAISIFLLLIVTIIAARYSPKIASIVSQCIIRVICLLILLSYTSFTSTSLQLLRPLYFNDVDGAYVYSSPSIKYFTGRHIPYGIIALLCGLVIVIGLPLLLLLEPFLKRKFNFIKIKPLLDQFQECYKAQYHWFAAYYLICRLVILAIIYISSFNKSIYHVQTACIIIVTIHVWIKPYNSDALNILDGIILLTMVLVINLNSFTFSRNATVALVVIMMMLPLLLFLCLMFGKKFSSIFKHTWSWKKTADGQEFIPRALNPVKDEEATE